MYHLSIITPEKVIFEGEVVSLTAPGAIGYLQVLQNHAPLMTTLIPGNLTIVEEGNKKTSWHLTGGFLEVQHNKAIILADGT